MSRWGGHGRRVEHDPASLGYPARKATATGTKRWPHRGPILDQGNVGGCVGWTTGDLLNTAAFWPLRRRRHGGKWYQDADCLEFYSGATRNDEWPAAEYPPVDEGTSALGAAKYLKSLGLITRYEHAFGLAHTRRALQLAPAMLGINWREAMDYPRPDGTVEVAGDVIGGHEVALLGVDERRRALECLNSWGPEFGRRGRFWIPFDGADELLDDDGDVLIIPLDAIAR
jgi:hypothetical protein